eukprot:378914-Ditylum_brightwellii.AAC.1
MNEAASPAPIDLEEDFDGGDADFMDIGDTFEINKEQNHTKPFAPGMSPLAQSDSPTPEKKKSREQSLGEVDSTLVPSPSTTPGVACKLPLQTLQISINH